MVGTSGDVNPLVVYRDKGWVPDYKGILMEDTVTIFPKTALIFGVTGQDGYYLTKLLLEKNYKVIGINRRSSVSNTERLDKFKSDDNFRLVEGDVTDLSCILSIISENKPNEIYNLAAQSHVGTSFSQPQLTWDVTAKGCMNILEAIRSVYTHIYKPKFYQASTSEMFGDQYSKAVDTFEAGDTYKLAKYQDENTPFNPQSPYAVAKLAAHHQTRLYREAYGIFACSGILFNHESKHRGEHFVTRKITKYVARLFDIGQRIDDNTQAFEDLGMLKLGNLDSSRDWGFAGDFVEAMWLMLQQDEPDDYVVATGVTNTITDLLDAAFDLIDLDWQDFVVQDPEFMRPAEVGFLLGNPEKARKKHGWTPKTTFEELIQQMVQADIDRERS